MSSRKIIKILSRKTMMIVMVILLIVWTIVLATQTFEQYNANRANRPKALPSLPEQYSGYRISSGTKWFKGTLTDAKYYKEYTVLFYDGRYKTLHREFKNLPLNEPIEIWRYLVDYIEPDRSNWMFEVRFPGGSRFGNPDKSMSTFPIP